jgi:hypothetical protein
MMSALQAKSQLLHEHGTLISKPNGSRLVLFGLKSHFGAPVKFKAIAGLSKKMGVIYYFPMETAFSPWKLKKPAGVCIAET